MLKTRKVTDPYPTKDKYEKPSLKRSKRERKLRPATSPDAGSVPLTNLLPQEPIEDGNNQIHTAIENKQKRTGPPKPGEGYLIHLLLTVQGHGKEIYRDTKFEFNHAKVDLLEAMYFLNEGHLSTTLQRSPVPNQGFILERPQDHSQSKGYHKTGSGHGREILKADQ